MYKRQSVPPVPQSIEDTGLNRGFLSDLVLKLVYLGGELLSLIHISEPTRPY